MKKTISITIGGIIFHIEEDGYERLKSYLDSVNAYFQSFDDNQEIISDIESRIAEIFLSKLTDGRQNLSITDIDELIATMGTTNDFEASIAEDTPNEPPSDTTDNKTAPETETSSDTTEPEIKRLYRDTKRGILGGICAGMAHYLKVDALWIRLLLLFCTVLINFWPFEGLFISISSWVILGYIILWVVIPPNGKLPDNQSVKKLFRNGGQRVLGGVASGIAAYSGIDVVLVRILFVIAIFIGGVGIIIYLILWIITPEAKTITEKMQMSGKPVTIKNIEDNLRKSLNMDEGDENPFVKLLLLPFRLLGLFLQAAGQFIRPVFNFLIDAIRVAFGICLILVSFFIILALTLSPLGMDAWSLWAANFHHFHHNLPPELFTQTLSVWLRLSILLIVCIPALSFMLLGLAIILKRSVIKAYLGWTLFAAWITGIVLFSLTAPALVADFTESAKIREEKPFQVSEATPTLRINDLGNDPFDAVNLTLRGHEDSTYLAATRMESRGADRSGARANARAAKYLIEQKSEDFYFDSKITIPETADFRFQEVDITFYIPFGKPFRMEPELSDILYKTLHPHGYHTYQIEGNDWVFDKEKGLICVTCPQQAYFDSSAEEDEGDKDADEAIDLSGISGDNDAYDGGDALDFPFENFNEVTLASLFDFEITKSQDNSYQVMVRGDGVDLDDVYINQVGSRLEASFKNKDWEWWLSKNNRRVKLLIALPELKSVAVDGASKGEITGFDQEQMEVSADGASKIYASINVENLEIAINGAAKVTLKGKGQDLQADLDGASKLKAFDFTSEYVDVETDGASNAEVYASQSIEAQADGVSKITYRGTTNVSSDSDGLSSIRRD